MKALIWIKDSFMSILLASVGILAVIATALFGKLKEKSKEAKEAVETINQNRKQAKALVERAQKREEELNEIQSDTYDPRESMSRYDK